MKLTVKPLTSETFADLEAIFRARGCSVARGCWCLYYRRSGETPAPPRGRTRAENNRLELRKRVKAGEFIGLIGYRAHTPVGWLSFGPRELFRKLERSPVMRAVDDRPVWSVVCFVVPSEFRGQGIAHELLKAAAAYAKKQGARLLEAYPVDKRGRAQDDSMWFGPKSMYDAAGFVEVARRKPTRPVVRLELVE